MCMCVAVVAWSWHVSVNSCDDVWSSRPQSRPQRGLSLLSSPAIAMQAITAALCSACCCSLHRVAKADGLTDTLRCGLFPQRARPQRGGRGSPSAGRQGRATGTHQVEGTAVKRPAANSPTAFPQWGAQPRCQPPASVLALATATQLPTHHREPQSMQTSQKLTIDSSRPTASRRRGGS